MTTGPLVTDLCGFITLFKYKQVQGGCFHDHWSFGY